ncbi:pancreatic triacylglycerol lipase-like [Crassostrea angulata]|uniref:pancreatic triacylglycerol lipase-like n=1 Tax=Magallana angulata TaxID=2784310 RepID=UPI0022B0ECB2|nr:pancreatic triacylglycerol lipase-like [Crassostrea angulata]
MMWQVLVLVSIWTLTGVNARTLSEDQAETLHNLHKRSSVCYDDLGCYSTGSPFWSIHRPLNILPQRPEKINTRFFLYTRSNTGHYTQLVANDYDSIRNSHFDRTKDTKFVSHGFLENGFVDWMAKMKDAFLKADDLNVILIDWGGGSSFPYTQATANTRVVGAEIAKLIKILQRVSNAEPTKIHVIGHSLGAHIAGYAGEKTPNLGRITGLDPAGPYFANTDIAVRLDPSDAIFVDALHTDSENLVPNIGFGMMQAVGHVDFYPNGGKDQPGCNADPVTQILIQGGIYDGTKQFIACNHLRAYEYFTESINSQCPFEGYSCDSFDHFQDGTCHLDCTVPGGCGKMGYHADELKSVKSAYGKKFFMKTTSRAPYCEYHYALRVTLGNPSGSHQWRGELRANIHGTNGQLGERVVTDDYVYFNPGQSYSFLIAVPHNIGEIRDVSLHWVHHGISINPFQWNPFHLRHPELFFQSVEVVAGDSFQKIKFCGTGGTESNSQRTLSTKC